LAKKKSKTVKKAGKSRSSKKKATSSSSASRKKSSKKKVTAKKSAKKTTAKKAPAKKKAGPKKSAAKASAGKTSKKKAPSRPDPGVTRTPGPKPSSIAAPRPVYVNGNNGDHVEWTPAKLRRVKTGLTRKDYNAFLALLLERRAEIVGDVASLEAARRAQDGDISHVPLHMADVGSDNYEQEFTLGLMESERRMVIEIDEAIGRIQDKTYGVCLETGRPIPRERLEIKPWAKYTIEVVRERERRGLPI